MTNFEPVDTMMNALFGEAEPPRHEDNKVVITLDPDKIPPDWLQRIEEQAVQQTQQGEL